MMPTVVVTFREDEQAVHYLREQGINPNQFAKQAFEGWLRRLRTEKAIGELQKMNVRLDRPIEDIMRELRDEQ